MSDDAPLLEIRDLRTHFHTVRGVAKAVDGVDITLRKGETLAVVGESGCGKSVTALTILRLLPDPPARIAGGQIMFDGVDLLSLPKSAMCRIRGNRIGMIFQEPMTSLSPVYTVGDQVAETFQLHQNLGRREAWRRAVEMLALVQIPEPERRARAYPHELSGGMRQRVMIAMAMGCRPELLIADEPTTALDVTVQSQILDLMLELRDELDSALMLITHDMGVVAETAERVLVMYAGRVVEEGSVKDIFAAPQHPYTQGLLGSVPKLGSRSANRRKRLKEIPGIVPSLTDLPEGCPFRARCPSAMQICAERMPDLFDAGKSHRARCWLVEQ